MILKKVKFKSLSYLLIVFLITFVVSCDTPMLSNAGFDAETMLNEGWSKLSSSQYDLAINNFQDILRDESVSSKYIAEANNALGWAYAKKNGIIAGEAYFEKAYSLVDDAKVGLAGICLSKPTRDNVERGITLLEELGLGSTSKVYKPSRDISVTNADVHAILALFYFYTNDHQKATEQFNLVKTLNAPDSSHVSPIIDQMIDTFEKSTY
jgi:tetratricopeptide (TPR) repeat protein